MLVGTNSLTCGFNWQYTADAIGYAVMIIARLDSLPSPHFRICSYGKKLKSVQYRAKISMYTLYNVVVASRIQRIGCEPQNLLHTVASLAWGLLKKEKRTKRESLAAHPPTHTDAACSEKVKQASRGASTCLLGATQVSVGLAPVQDSFGSSTRPTRKFVRVSPCVQEIIVKRAYGYPRTGEAVKI